MHFFRNEVQVFSSPSSRLGKHQTSEILLMDDFFFMIFFKNSFSTFSDTFKNNQLHILTSLYAFHLC